MRDKENECYAIDGNSIMELSRFERIGDYFALMFDYGAKKFSKILGAYLQKNTFNYSLNLFQKLKTYYLSKKLSKEIKKFIDEW